jgi:hypothetical protein
LARLLPSTRPWCFFQNETTSSSSTDKTTLASLSLYLIGLPFDFPLFYATFSGSSTQATFELIESIFAERLLKTLSTTPFFDTVFFFHTPW